MNAPEKFDYSPWRHGGWYVMNVHYPSGAVGCVSRNYADGKWRIACDPRPFEEQPTFKTRDAAARAEWELIHAEDPQPTTRPTFSFDGFGINGPDEYRSRLATFTRAGQEYPNLGPMLEAAPDMLEALRGMVDCFGDVDDDHVDAPVVANARAVLARAEGNAK